MGRACTRLLGKVVWAPPRVLHPPSHLLTPNLLTYFGSVQKRGAFSAKFPSPSRASMALYREGSRFGTYFKFSLPSLVSTSQSSPPGNNSFLRVQPPPFHPKRELLAASRTSKPRGKEPRTFGDITGHSFPKTKAGTCGSPLPGASPVP